MFLQVHENHWWRDLHAPTVPYSGNLLGQDPLKSASLETPQLKHHRTGVTNCGTGKGQTRTHSLALPHTSLMISSVGAGLSA